MFPILRIEYFESLESNAELTLRVFFGTLNVNSGLTEPIFFGHRTIAGTACGIVDGKRLKDIADLPLDLAI